GAVVLFILVLGGSLGSRTGAYGHAAYGFSCPGMRASIAVSFGMGCCSLLHTFVLSALHLESPAWGAGVKQMADAALRPPIASTPRAALVSLYEFLTGAAVLLVEGLALAFVLGCLFHLAREAVAANTPGGKEHFQAPYEEFNRGELDTGLWAQCLARADGNE